MRNLLLAAVCLLTTLGWSQGTAASGIPVVATGTGQPIAGATVAVCSADPGSAPSVLCTGSLVTTFTSNSLSVACTANPVTKAALSGVGCTNPGLSDGLGNVIAYANPAACWLEYTGNGIIGIVVMPCTFPALSTTGGVAIKVNGGSTLTSPVNFQNGSAVNGITISFANPSASNVTAAISGALTNAGIANPSTTVNGQTCTLGSTCTISGFLSGLTAGIIPQAGSATTIVNSTPQLDNGVTTPNTLTYLGSGGLALTPGGLAGIASLGQGTAQGLGANSVGLTAPTGVTSYNYVWPAAAGNGYLKGTNSANIVTGAFSFIDLTADVTGILPPANGGSGIASPAIHKLLVANGSSPFTQLPVANTGTVLSGSAGADPFFTGTPVLGGTALGANGTLGFSGLTSGTVTIQPQAIAGTYNYNLPITAGSAGDCLKSGGGGASPQTFGPCGSAIGGVNSQTTNYTPVLGDSGKSIVMNGTSLTVTLPNPPPSSTWNVQISNLNATTLTISRNALLIDTAASNLTLVQPQSVYITTDGTNYFTDRGVTTTVQGSNIASVITSGLIGHYPFNEGSGTVVTDVSGNGNNGSFVVNVGFPQWIAGSGGLNFDGNVHQTFVSMPSALNAAVTIQVFVGHQFQTTTGTSVFHCLVCGNNTPGTSGTAGLIYTEATYATSQTYTGMRPRLQTWGNGTQTALTAVAPGNFLATVVQDAAADKIYVNSSQGTFTASTGSSLGLQTLGNYQIGGRSAITGSFVSYCTCQIYYALFYNRALTQVEIAQNSAAINAIMQNRGITVGQFNNYQANQIFSDGDSEQDVANGWTQGNVAFNATQGGFQVIYVNLSGSGTSTLPGRAPFYQTGMLPLVGMNVYHLQIGANDLASSATTEIQQLGSYLQTVRARGYKVLLEGVFDKTGSSAAKNTFNANDRATWRSIADGFVDVAGDPVLGADGAAANTVYFSGGLHVTATGQIHRGVLLQRGVNRLYGRLDFNSARTYTTTSPAATAITAATETTNFATLTIGAHTLVVGQFCTVAGVTPAGYNGNWPITAIAGTTVTVYNDTTGLGAGSVFGTISCPSQLDDDVYTTLGGAGAGLNFNIQSCMGYSGQNFYFRNTNTNSWTVTAFGTEQIDGASTMTVTAGSTAVIQSILSTPSSPTCAWRRIQ